MLLCDVSCFYVNSLDEHNLAVRRPRVEVVHMLDDLRVRY